MQGKHSTIATGSSSTGSTAAGHLCRWWGPLCASAGAWRDGRARRGALWPARTAAVRRCAAADAAAAAWVVGLWVWGWCHLMPGGGTGRSHTQSSVRPLLGPYGRSQQRRASVAPRLCCAQCYLMQGTCASPVLCHAQCQVLVGRCWLSCQGGTGHDPWDTRGAQVACQAGIRSSTALNCLLPHS